MALILEQLDLRRGNVVRRVVVAPGQSVGRALDSTLVVEDAHVDVHHAHITMAVDGLVLEDLGSVNGITLLNGERTQSVALVPGARFHLGKTAFRVVDGEAGLPPAVPLLSQDTPRTTEFESAFSTTPRWYDRRWIQLSSVVVCAVWFAMSGFLTDSSRAAGTNAFSIGIAAVMLTAMGGGFWALIARLVGRKAGFLAQSTVTATVWIAMLAQALLFSYAAFLAPGLEGALDFVGGLAVIALSVWTLHTQLGIATALSSRRRLIGTSIGIGIVLALGFGYQALEDKDAFTDVPEFNKTLVLMPAGAVPATDVSGFRESLAELRQDVDSLKSRSSVLSQR